MLFFLDGLIGILLGCKAVCPIDVCADQEIIKKKKQNKTKQKEKTRQGLISGLGIEELYSILTVSLSRRDDGF